MPLLEVGRLCIKTAGREAGLKCVIVEVTDKNFGEGYWENDILKKVKCSECSGKEFYELMEILKDE